MYILLVFQVQLPFLPFYIFFCPWHFEQLLDFSIFASSFSPLVTSDLDLPFFVLIFHRIRRDHCLFRCQIRSNCLKRPWMIFSNFLDFPSFWYNFVGNSVMIIVFDCCLHYFFHLWLIWDPWQKYNHWPTCFVGWQWFAKMWKKKSKLGKIIGFFWQFFIALVLQYVAFYCNYCQVLHCNLFKWFFLNSYLLVFVQIWLQRGWTNGNRLGWGKSVTGFHRCCFDHTVSFLFDLTYVLNKNFNLKYVFMHFLIVLLLFLFSL